MTPGQVLSFEETVREWFGDGCQPSPDAQKRADICKTCPFNYHGGWMFPKAVAETVRRWAEARVKLNLHVEGEEQLGHCEICNCVLKLKIHVPQETILHHTSKEVLTSLPSWCWLKAT